MIEQREEIERLLQEGVAAARSGQKSAAQTLLSRVLKLDRRNEQAWLWLSAVVETNAQRMEALEQVLRINPANAAALRGLEHLRAQADAPATAAPATGSTTVLGRTAPVEPDASPILDELRPMLAASNQRKRFGIRMSEAIIVIVVFIAGILLIRLFLDKTFPEPNRPVAETQQEAPPEEAPPEEAPPEEAPPEEAPPEELPPEELPPEEAPPEEVPPEELPPGPGTYSSSSYTLIVNGSSAGADQVAVQLTLQNPTFGNLRFNGADFRLIDSTGAELPLDPNRSSLVRGNTATYRSIAAQDQTGGELVFSGAGTAPFQLIWTPSDTGETVTIAL